MKFLCVECDALMEYAERQQPDDGTFAVSFTCPACGRRIAMLANPMETQVVSALGVRIGGSTLDEPPMELVRGNVVGRSDAFGDSLSPVRVRPIWSTEAVDRLAHVPSFVRGMVKRIYMEYAVEHEVVEITPAVMDRARQELGLEGM